ncbi:FtsX-like permease family protein [Kitasatospora sp. NPDC056531]|uniref:ABC transporter permease n=1 Tax=Kitasatospora sp. NPDC056531 TaxID=3345856 RepID=UPI0036C0C952
MSAVWRVARAAVARRRLQTVIIGFVVLLSTATLVVAMGLMDAASSPFDRVFDKQHGAHVAATYDKAVVTDEQLRQTADRPGVTAGAGPFEQATLTVPPRQLKNPVPPGALTVVGRPGPDSAVDNLNLWAGRWAAAPGEIVVNLKPYPGMAKGMEGQKVPSTTGESFTVVGYAYSVSQTAGAWVTPEQARALHPAATQMLYRFDSAQTGADIDADVAAVTAGLPQKALAGSQSYLTVKHAVAAGPGTYVPFLMVFGILGVIVAVLIVANVVSGAVVSGLRHIGVLKSLGFTPWQVVSVYLLMMSLPAVLGCVLGIVGGHFATDPLLDIAFQGSGMDRQSIGVAPWVDVVALVAMPLLVILAALVPALKAKRLSASQAISAGSAPEPGRALAVQRWLSGTRLPRAVSLGLGLPFARPGRTALTLAAIILGVTTTTFATGMADSVTQYGNAVLRTGAYQVQVGSVDPREGTPTKLSDAQIEALLHSQPGTQHLTLDAMAPVTVVGNRQVAFGDFFRGDYSTLGFQGELAEGRWLNGPGEAVLSSGYLHKLGLAVGDRITLEVAGKQATVTVVGTVMGVLQDALYSELKSIEPVSANNLTMFRFQYLVQLAEGTDAAAYMNAVQAADPGLTATEGTDTFAYPTVVSSLSTVLTLVLGIVAALGVFNTVVLNARERRRNLGMLKSIGMTPRQVVVMMVTSMAALGLAGGLVGIPLGILAHRVIVPLTTSAAQIDIPERLMNVWHAPGIALLCLAGVVIAVLGAYLPARATARLTIAEALRNE